MGFFIRKTSSSHADPLDGLRALSIILVILFHAFFFVQYAFESNELFLSFSQHIPTYLSWIRRGDLGVDIFFVLSAFLIGSQLLKAKAEGSPTPLRTFYLKRFLRIYPIYLVALGIFTLAKGPSIHALGNIFAYNNIVNLEKIIIPWSWSLSVEIQFYLIFPLFILAVNKAKTAAIIGVLLIAGSLLWMGYFYLSHPTLSQQSVMDLITINDKETSIYYMQFLYVVPPARAASFVFGVTAAWLWVHHKPQLLAINSRHTNMIKLCAAGCIAGLIAIASFDIYQPSHALSDTQKALYKVNMISARAVFSALIAAIILITLSSSKNTSLLSKFLSHPFWFPLAKGSYAMYLFHPPFLFLGFYCLFGEQKLTTLSNMQLLSIGLLGIIFSFIFSFIMYHLVERWFTYRLISRLTNKIKTQRTHS